MSTTLKPARDAHLIAIAQVYSAVYAAVLCSSASDDVRHDAAVAAANAVSDFDRFLDRRG
jgi:hypothetical protein